jgi:hypothetical protein
LIAPYRENNRHRRYEDGRKLRRYKRRWIVERTNAWLGQFRRLLVRHEHLLSTYRAFFYLALLLDYAETLFMKYALVISSFVSFFICTSNVRIVSFCRDDRANPNIDLRLRRSAYLSESLSALMNSHLGVIEGKR